MSSNVSISEIFSKTRQLQHNNMNDNPKNNILMSENIRQKGLTILKYFDAYICHHYQPIPHINMGINQITAVLLMLLGQN